MSMLIVFIIGLLCGVLLSYYMRHGKRWVKAKAAPSKRTTRVVHAHAVPELRPPARTTTNVRRLQARLAAAAELATVLGYGAELRAVIADVDAAMQQT